MLGSLLSLGSSPPRALVTRSRSRLAAYVSRRCLSVRLHGAVVSSGSTCQRAAMLVAALVIAGLLALAIVLGVLVAWSAVDDLDAG